MRLSLSVELLTQLNTPPPVISRDDITRTLGHGVRARGEERLPRIREPPEINRTGGGEEGRIMHACDTERFRAGHSTSAGKKSSECSARRRRARDSRPVQIQPTDRSIASTVLWRDH